jgi:hypothetical protein
MEPTLDHWYICTCTSVLPYIGQARLEFRSSHRNIDGHGTRIFARAKLGSTGRHSSSRAEKYAASLLRDKQSLFKTGQQTKHTKTNVAEEATHDYSFWHHEHDQEAYVRLQAEVQERISSGRAESVSFCRQPAMYSIFPDVKIPVSR